MSLEASLVQQIDALKIEDTAASSAVESSTTTQSGSLVSRAVTVLPEAFTRQYGPLGGALADALPRFSLAIVGITAEYSRVTEEMLELLEEWKRTGSLSKFLLAAEDRFKNYGAYLTKLDLTVMVNARQKEFVEEADSQRTRFRADLIYDNDGPRAYTAFWAEKAERQTREMQKIRESTTFDITNLQKFIIGNFPNLHELTIRCTEESATYLRTRNIPQLKIVKD